MSDAIVETRGLEVRFPLPTHFLSREKPVLHALNTVDIAIRPGESFCVVGESGCGKTTLGRAIIGLQADGGRGIFNGQRIDTMDEATRKPIRRDMQMVFQNPYASLNPRRNVFETLAEPVRHLMSERSGADVRAQVEEVLDATGCDPSWQRKLPHEFSGGQRQRIAIARALVTNPAFIVADEPISALDVSIQAQILNLLTDLQAERGLTYLFITHDLSVVEHFGTRVAVMYLGRVMELAETETLFDSPQAPLFAAPARRDPQDRGRLVRVAARARRIARSGQHAARMPLRAALPDRRGALPGRAPRAARAGERHAGRLSFRGVSRGRATRPAAQAPGGRRVTQG